MPDDMPDERTVLAFDYGTLRIGVALGNCLIGHARPLEIIDTPQKVKRFARIEELIVHWQPETLVVGLPLTPDGGEQPASRQARRFANQLEGRYGLPVSLVDERGSSMAAQQIVGNAPDDAVAAAIILQRYFDAPNFSLQEPSP
jgi:putative Holliday junction resolvase